MSIWAKRLAQQLIVLLEKHKWISVIAKTMLLAINLSLKKLPFSIQLCSEQRFLLRKPVVTWVKFFLSGLVTAPEEKLVLKRDDAVADRS